MFDYHKALCDIASLNYTVHIFHASPVCSDSHIISDNYTHKHSIHETHDRLPPPLEPPF